MKNIERVWKAEQKHEAERKKIEELQKELKDERNREEMTRYAEETGAIKLVLQQSHFVESGKSKLCVKRFSFSIATERGTIVWTGCTRAQLAMCQEMSIFWDVQLTNRSPISMRSLRVAPQMRPVSCRGPSSIPLLKSPPLTWLPRSGKIPFLQLG